MPNIQFQVRRGTASTWTSTNPTLANGEFGFETDTRQLKIGNNVAWNVLPYLNIGQAANWSAFPAYQTVDMSVNILNNVGSIRNGAGTVSAPSYTFMNDVSMGLYDPATNVLGIVTSGVERMRVAANGNVGIATNNPTFTLDVSGNTRFGTSNSSYGNIAGFVNIDSGALGTTIGNTIDHMAIRSTNGNTDQLRFYSRRDLNAVSGWQSAPLTIQRYVDGTLNPFGFIKFGGTNNNQGVSIGSGSTDTLNVTSGGLVGIGRQPGYPLDIQYNNFLGGINETGLRITNTATGNSSQINLVSSRSWSAMAVGTAGAPAGGFTITDNTAVANRIVIDVNGKVGINTSAPDYMLHVRASSFGMIRADNYLGQFAIALYSDVAVYSDWGASASIAYIGSTQVGDRSINAGGSVNAFGSDYAEYMTKDQTNEQFSLEKGDIVGVTSNGLLTNKFDNAISFVIKTTKPSFVGGDTWGTKEKVGEKPTRPVDTASQEEMDMYTQAFAEWETNYEAERQKVDRISFSGQVPVNISNAVPGHHVVPARSDTGGIIGISVPDSTITFEEYRKAVGKIIKIDENGKAIVIVKVA